MILRYIVNLVPKRQYGITEQIDNTIVPPNVAPSEFSQLYASRAGPGPAESLFS